MDFQLIAEGRALLIVISWNAYQDPQSGTAYETRYHHLLCDLLVNVFEHISDECQIIGVLAFHKIDDIFQEDVIIDAPVQRAHIVWKALHCIDLDTPLGRARAVEAFAVLATVEHLQVFSEQYTVFSVSRSDVDNAGRGESPNELHYGWDGFRIA